MIAASRHVLWSPAEWCISRISCCAYESAHGDGRNIASISLCHVIGESMVAGSTLDQQRDDAAVSLAGQKEDVRDAAGLC